MIVDSILLLIEGLVNILLAPLSVINIGIDFISSIPIIVSFLNVVVYVLPWDNLLPLFVLLIGLFSFRIVVALIRFIKSFIPTMGGM